MCERFFEATTNNPQITIVDWIMLIVTVIYVIATIFIFVANSKSAKATNEQVKMMHYFKNKL